MLASIARMRVAGLFVLPALVAACGGAPAHKAVAHSHVVPPVAVAANGDVAPQPLQVEIKAKRLGSALHLDIIGIGRGRLEGEAFEDPTLWNVVVTQQGRRLDHLVNGPIHLARDPAGRASGSRWDVTVSFSSTFHMKSDQLPVEVLVRAPEERPVTVEITEL